MAFSYSRRDIVVAACSVGLVVLAQPGIAAPMSFKVDLNGAQQGTAGANRRHRHG
jgi:hypothetical protein